MILPDDKKELSQEAANAKLRLVLGMQRSGIRMMRQNLIARHPGETAEQIDQRLSQWLAKTPDASDPRFEVRSCRTPSKSI